MNNLKRYNNIKYQLKQRFNKVYSNYNPYLYINNSKYIKDKLYKSILQTLLYYLPKNKLICNKIYNVTEKKCLRMGKGKGKISYISTNYYGNKPLWLNNSIKYNKYKLIYLRHSFNKISRKYNFIDFK